MLKIVKSINLFLIFLLLTGCLKPVPAPNIIYYRLDTTSHFAANKSSQKTLLVLVPTAASGYQTTGIIYSLYPYQLSAYTKHQWIAPPAQMLQSAIAQSMQNTRYFSAVVTSPMVAKTNYVLSAQLVKLQQDFHGNESQVLMQLRASLIDDQNRVIINRLYSVVQPVAEPTPYGAVKAANLAAQVIQTQLSQDVVKAASK